MAAVEKCQPGEGDLVGDDEGVFRRIDGVVTPVGDEHGLRFSKMLLSAFHSMVRARSCRSMVCWEPSR